MPSIAMPAVPAVISRDDSDGPPRRIIVFQVGAENYIPTDAEMAEVARLLDSEYTMEQILAESKVPVTITSFLPPDEIVESFTFDDHQNLLKKDNPPRSVWVATGATEQDIAALKGHVTECVESGFKKHIVASFGQISQMDIW